MKHVAGAFLLLILATSAAFSQEFRASIAGEVTDPSGAPVADAKVIVTHVERNTPTEATTNEVGRYLVQFLVPGRYTMTVEKTGFKKFVRENINLNSPDRLGLDVRLELGGVTESVTVTADVLYLQTETATRSALVENRLIENIPTSGRNLYHFQYTQPGVVKNSNYWGDFELYATGNINGVIMGGGRPGENESLIDGVSDTRGDRGVAFAPSLNSVQEVTLQTNTYDAQFGRVGGGVTSIIVKSGTNALHGQLFEFLENEKLYATPWANNALGRGRSPFKLNTFGFEFDGPVYVPKLFDGRNRAFFMISLEALRERNPGLQVANLPTADMLQGNFSGLRTAQGQPITIFDPTSTRLGADGRTYTRLPFQDNRIPAALINPVARNVASFYPQPNRPGGIGPDNAGNYVLVTPAKNGYDSWHGRMDLRISQKSNIAYRYGQTPWTNFAQVRWGTNPAEPSGEAPSTRIMRHGSADWTYTLNPAMVFNLRFGVARYEGFSGNIFAAGFDPRQLGFPDTLVRQFTRLQFPRFDLGFYQAIGADRVTSYETHDTWSLQPNLGWTRGRHNMRYGAEYRLYNRNQLNAGAASGRYSFSRQWTQANPLQADALSGNEFASFLLGYPSGGSVDRNSDPAWRNGYIALFVQDDWKVTPRLTVNLGLRWDYEGPRVERYNRMVRGFAFDQASPIAAQVQGLTLRGGLVYTGSSGEARQAFFPDKNNFQPRVGVAWQFRPKWVLRGGYGLTYLGQASSGPDTGFSRTTTLTATTDNVTPAVDLRDPYPTRLWPTGLLQPIGSSQGLATNLGFGVSAQFLDRALPYSHQFSVGVQREMPWGFLLDASYAGNITRKLPVGLGLNYIPTTALNSLPVAERPAYFNAQVTNPMRGLFAGGALNGANIPRFRLLHAYPHFDNVGISDVPIGRQHYDSFQLKATRRFSSGLAMQIAYTLSKTLEQIAPLNAQDVNLGNLLDTPLHKRLIEFDVPHVLAVLTSYELPFGRGKRWGSAMHPVLNGFAGGWNINVQYLMRSGHPWDFPNAAPLVARSAKFTHSQRDELARSRGRSEYDPFFDDFLDASIFPRTAQAPFTLRDYPTRFPDVRFKALNVAEISVSKDFPIRERAKIQIRADFQNAFNYPWFSRGAVRPPNVTNTRWPLVEASPRSESREVIAVMKVLF